MMSNVKKPYVGTRTFTEDQADLFYGREREARDLLALVLTEQVVLFYAQSGTGKSSLLYTRLIPNLEKGKGFEVLPTGRVTSELPRNVAIDNIYMYSLMRNLVSSEIEPEKLASLQLKDFLSGLVRDPGSEKRAYSYHENPPAPATTQKRRRRVLIIDQFEELFSTHPEEWQCRSNFFEQLAEAMEQDPYLWLVLVMREDYIAYLDPYAHLMPGGLRVRYYMQRMEYDAALKAVSMPVKNIRPYTEGVAEKLVEDLCGKQTRKRGDSVETVRGQYVEPIVLQAVCSTLWENLDEGGSQITFEDLKVIKDVNEALGKYYEQRVQAVASMPEVIEKGVKESTIRKWFGTRLITDEGKRTILVRDPGRKSGGLDDGVIQIIKGLNDLVREEEHGGSSIYELTHDRLVDPIRENNAAWFSEHQSPLQRQAALWEDQGKNENWLLSDQALVDMQDWANAHQEELSETEKEFLQASQKKQAQLDELKKAERLQLEAATNLAQEKARSATRARIFNGIAVILLIAAGYFAYNANQQKKSAQKESDKAAIAQAKAEAATNQALQQSEIATSSDLILRADDNSEDQPDLATLLRIEAFNLNPDSARTRKELLTALQDFTGLDSFWKRPATQTLFSPDGKTIATLDKDGIKLWDLQNRDKPKSEAFNGHYDPIYTSSFSPDGKYLASGSSDSSVVLWNSEKGKAPQALTQPLKVHTAWVDSVVFSPNGSILASASDDLKIILWDVSRPAYPIKVNSLSGHTGWISSLAFSSDGKILASGATDGTFYLWDVADAKKARKISGPLSAAGSVYSIAMSRDNQLLAVGSTDGSFTVWDISNPRDPTKESETLNDEISPSGIFGLAFSPVKDRLLAVGSGSSINLWDVSDPQKPQPVGEPITEHGEAKSSLFNDYIYSVVFSPDGKILASSSFDGANAYLILWNVSDPETPVELASPLVGSARINSMSYDPADGSRLVTASRDGALLLWDVSDPKNPVQVGAPQKGHVGKPAGMSFSDDGSILISSGDDGSILIDTLTGSLLGAGTIANSCTDQQTMVLQYVDSANGKDIIQVRGKPGSSGSSSESIEGKCLALSPTNQTLVYTSHDEKGRTTLNLWDINAGKAVKTDIEGTYLGFSKDGKVLAYQILDSDKNAEIYLMNTSDGVSLGGPIQGDYVLFTPDSKLLLYQTLDEAGKVFIEGWDLSSKKPGGLHAEGIFKAIDSNSKYLVSLIQDARSIDTLSLVEIATGKNIFFKTSYEGDLNNIYLANTTIFYQAYDMVRGETTFNLLNTTNGHTDRATTSDIIVQLSPDGKTLVYDTYDAETGTNLVNLLNMTTGEAIGSPTIGSFSQFLQDRPLLVYQTYDSNSGSYSIALLDMKTGATVGTRHLGSNLKLVPDQSALLVSNYDTYDSADLVDVATGLSVGSLPSGASLLGFSKDGTRAIYSQPSVSCTPKAVCQQIGFFDLKKGLVLGETAVKGSNPALQPNGDLLATTGASGIIYFWDVSKSADLGEVIEKVSSPVKSMTLDPKGKTAAIVSEDGITLQDLATGSARDMANHHIGSVNSVLFNTSANILLSVGDDGKSILWDPKTMSIKGKPIDGEGTGFGPDGKVLVVVNGEKRMIQFLGVANDKFDPVGKPVVGDSTIFSPDGKFLVVEDFQNNASTIVDMSKLEPITKNPVPGTNVLFSPKGEFVAIGDSQNATQTTVFDLASSQQLGKDPIYANAILFSPDAKILVTADYSGENPTFWALTPTSIKFLRSLENVTVAETASPPDGKFLLLTDDSGGFQLWDLSGPRKINLEITGSNPQISSNGKYLVTSAGDSVNLWDLETRKKLDLPIKGGNPVFSPEGKYLAVSKNDRLFLWDLAAGSQLNIQVKGSDPVFSPNNEFLAVSVESEEIQSTTLWDLRETAPKEASLKGSKAAFTPDSKFIITTEAVYDLDLEAPKPVIEETGIFRVTSGGNISVIYGSTGILLWDNLKHTGLGSLTGHSGSIDNSVFSPDGRILASIASDGIILSDIATGEQIGSTIPGNYVSFSADSKWIAVSAETNETAETSVWDISDPKSFQLLNQESLTGNRGTFSPDDRYLTTTNTQAKTTLLWDTITWKQDNEFPGLYSQFNQNGSKLAVLNAASGDRQSSTISILDLAGDVKEDGKITLEKPCAPELGQCNFLAFSQDGQYLAYNDGSYSNPDGSSSTDTYLWNVARKDKESLSAPIKIDGNISDLHFVFDNLLVVETADGAFTIWEIPSGIQLSNPIRGEFQDWATIGDQRGLLYISPYSRDLLFWSYTPATWTDQLCKKVRRNLLAEEWNRIFPDTFKYNKTCPSLP